MTKEELIQLSDEGNLSKYELEEFFKQNICIPKDDMEHLKWIYERLVYRHGEDKNVDYMLKFASIISIKPSEPIYEWQWYYIDDGIAKIHPELMTHGEVTDFRHSFIIEETKRVRQ